MGLLTAEPARGPKSALSRPVFSEPVHFVILVNSFMVLILHRIFAATSRKVSIETWGSNRVRGRTVHGLQPYRAYSAASE